MFNSFDNWKIFKSEGAKNKKKKEEVNVKKILRREIKGLF